MEVLLTSEILYQSPRFHQAIRNNLIKCTDCIVQDCKGKELGACVKDCMKPCIEFKLTYEEQRNRLLEDLKQDMLKKCLRATDQQPCIKEINSEYLKKLSSIFSSFDPK